MTEEAEFLTVDEFASKMRVHPKTVRSGIKKGHIQACRTGIGPRTSFRIPKTELTRICEVDMMQVIQRLINEKLEEKDGKI